jgi:hypothetical protein
MSKMIEELTSKKCKITSQRGIFLTGKPEFECHVIDCDGEWIKISLKNKHNNEIIKLLRVEDIEEVQII